MSSGETYTIGKVVKKLSASYPDLTVSKVRFLESEGLVTPTRTKSGYRSYSDKDVDRLELVLRLQKTCFYPLSVIKERLDSGDLDEETALLESEAASQDKSELYKASHLLEDLPGLINVPVSFVRSLQDAGLVEVTKSPAGRNIVDGRELPLIQAAYELKRYGIDPRFLRAHIQRANREVPLFKQVISSSLGRQGGLDDQKSVRVFDATLERLLKLSNTVSDSLIRRSLRAEFNYPSSDR